MNSLLEGILKNLKLIKKSLDKSQLTRRKGSNYLINQSYQASLLLCNLDDQNIIWYVPLLPLCLVQVGIDEKIKQNNFGDSSI